MYGAEGLPDYAEWFVLYRWGYSAGACFFGHVPVGAFTFGADRDYSPPWYPRVAAPFTLQLGKRKFFHTHTYRRYVSFLYHCVSEVTQTPSSGVARDTCSWRAHINVCVFQKSIYVYG